MELMDNTDPSQLQIAKHDSTTVIDRTKNDSTMLDRARNNSTIFDNARDYDVKQDLNDSNDTEQIVNQLEQELGNSPLRKVPLSTLPAA